MKVPYLIGCALSYRHYLNYVDAVFSKEELNLPIRAAQRCGKLNNETASRGPPKGFARTELHLIVYYNLVFTLVLTVIAIYGTIVSDRAIALYNGEGGDLTGKLLRSPLVGEWVQNALLGRLVKVVLLHHAIVGVLLMIDSSPLRTRAHTLFAVRTVYVLSSVATSFLL